MSSFRENNYLENHHHRTSNRDTASVGTVGSIGRKMSFRNIFGIFKRKDQDLFQSTTNLTSVGTGNHGMNLPDTSTVIGGTYHDQKHSKKKKRSKSFKKSSIIKLSPGFGKNKNSNSFLDTHSIDGTVANDDFTNATTTHATAYAEQRTSILQIAGQQTATGPHGMGGAAGGSMPNVNDVGRRYPAQFDRNRAQSVNSRPDYDDEIGSQATLKPAHSIGRLPHNQPIEGKMIIDMEEYQQLIKAKIQLDGIKRLLNDSHPSIQSIFL